MWSLFFPSSRGSSPGRHPVGSGSQNDSNKDSHTSSFSRQETLKQEGNLNISTSNKMPIDGTCSSSSSSAAKVGHFFQNWDTTEVFLPSVLKRRKSSPSHGNSTSPELDRSLLGSPCTSPIISTSSGQKRGIQQQQRSIAFETELQETNKQLQSELNALKMENVEKEDSLRLVSQQLAELKAVASQLIRERHLLKQQRRAIMDQMQQDHKLRTSKSDTSSPRSAECSVYSYGYQYSAQSKPRTCSTDEPNISLQQYSFDAEDMSPSMLNHDSDEEFETILQRFNRYSTGSSGGNET